MMSVVIVLVFMCCITVGLSAEEVSSRRVTIDSEPISKWYFMNKLLVQYGDGEYLTIADVQKLLEMLKKNEKDNMTHEKEQFRRSTDSDQTEPSTNVSGTCEARDNWMDDPECLDNIFQYTRQNGLNATDSSVPYVQDLEFRVKCMSAVEIFQFHELSTDRVNASLLHEISPTILYTAQTMNCVEKKQPIGRPKAAEVWGYSFVCVTFINLCSLMGMVFLPLMHKSFYKKLLMFMVALAVGTLSGSSLLFLIPECFDMASEDNPFFSDYVWRCTTVIGGIYMFFVVERVLKNIMDWRKDDHAVMDSSEKSLINAAEFAQVK
ncbi:hypothetical protein LSH36_121g00043 [Paralvinella palmiformis]|uniref:Uncharacterized protein n=1 Tax=Paralvinella palmiformis TaxID=53620 RepID=A0AAD9JXM5_9ANNE|nr:hypothetical protein LSH36_121g00043 [Paralvinella palmiformis]